MQSITLTNDNGTLTIGQSAPYFLQLLDGVGGLQATIQQTKSPFQDGSTYAGSYFNNRNITFTIFLKAASEAALNGYKRTLQNIINPKLETTLTYTNGTYTKQIICHAEYSPVWSQEKGFWYQQCFISMICNQPFWEDTTETGEIFSLSVPNFSFDLELTDTYELETDGTNRITITNDGDIETPVYIEFTGPATNPKILNETTGEYVKVTETLNVGDVLEINTEFGNKEVLKNGVNAFSSIDINSTFFQLALGENIISYSVDTGIDTAICLLRYRKKYIGL